MHTQLSAMSSGTGEGLLPVLLKLQAIDPACQCAKLMRCEVRIGTYEQPFQMHQITPGAQIHTGDGKHSVIPQSLLKLRLLVAEVLPVLAQLGVTLLHLLRSGCRAACQPRRRPGTG
ncbi:hypothetical protein D3C72_2078530 [compost metagenome]